MRTAVPIFMVPASDFLSVGTTTTTTTTIAIAGIVTSKPTTRLDIHGLAR
jgi:hypothetical protein